MASPPAVRGAQSNCIAGTRHDTDRALAGVSEGDRTADGQLQTRQGEDPAFHQAGLSCGSTPC